MNRFARVYESVNSKILSGYPLNLGHFRTVSLYGIKLFISRPCPILVLTTVLGRRYRADVQNSVKNYQGPTTSRENAIQKYQISPIRFFIFLLL